MEKIKLSEWAKRNGVCYRTAYNYFRQGRFEGKYEVTDKGSIYVFEQRLNSNLEKIVQDFITAVKNLNK